MTMTLHCLYLLMCFCPPRPGGICILFISNSKPLSGLIRSWHPPTSPPWLLPISASPTGLQTVLKIIKLFPDSGSLFLQQPFPGMPPTPSHTHLDISIAGFLLTFISLFKCHFFKIPSLANQSEVVFLPCYSLS